jgi:hypothetical protein
LPKNAVFWGGAQIFGLLPPPFSHCLKKVNYNIINCVFFLRSSKSTFFFKKFSLFPEDFLKDKKNCKDWIYYIAGNENIKQFNSSPYRIIKDLQNII